MNIGIIGCGRAAELIYLPALNKFPQVHVTAVVDPLKERREFISGKIKKCRAYASIVPEFIGEVDAAIITTPPGSHVSTAAALLSKNKFVLVEKPLALSMEGINELIRAEEKSKASLMMGFNHRYWLPAVKLKEKLSGERKITSAEILFSGDYSKWNPVSFKSDPLNDLGPHVFDLVRFIFAKEIISIKAESVEEKSLLIKIRIGENLIVDARIAHSGKTKKTIKAVAGNEKYFAVLGSERVSPEMNLNRRILELKDRIRRKMFRQASPVKKSFEMQLENFFKLIESKKIEYAGIDEGVSAILAVNAAKDSIKENGKEICLNENK